LDREQYLKAMLERIFDESVDFADIHVEGMVSAMGPAVDLGPDEVGAVTLTNAKTAGLFFDKVWRVGSWPQDVPEELRFGGSTEEEMEEFGRLILVASISELVKKEGLSISGEADPLYKKLSATKYFKPVQGLVRDLAKDPLKFSGNSKMDILDRIPRAVSEILSQKHGLAVFPVYSSSKFYEEEYRSGDYAVAVATVRNLDVVVEDELSWDQVLEVKQDRESSRRLRDMIRWLDTKMVGKTSAEIEDRVANMLRDYETALQKHGIATKKGVLQSVIDPKFLGAAGVVAGQLGPGAIESLAVFAALMGVKGLISVATGTIDLKEAKPEPNPEVAFIVELGDTQK